MSNTGNVVSVQEQRQEQRQGMSFENIKKAEMKSMTKEERLRHIQDIKLKLQMSENENAVFTKRDLNLMKLYLKPEERYLLDLLYNPIPLVNKNNLAETPTVNTVHWGQNDYGNIVDDKDIFIFQLREKQVRNKKFLNFIRKYLEVFLDQYTVITKNIKNNKSNNENVYFKNNKNLANVLPFGNHTTLLLGNRL